MSYALAVEVDQAFGDLSQNLGSLVSTEECIALLQEVQKTAMGAELGDKNPVAGLILIPVDELNDSWVLQRPQCHHFFFKCTPLLLSHELLCGEDGPIMQAADSVDNPKRASSCFGLEIVH